MFSWVKTILPTQKPERMHVVALCNSQTRFDSIVRLLHLLEKLDVPVRGVTPSLALGLARGVTHKTEMRRRREEQRGE